jgi:hypothetical protein
MACGSSHAFYTVSEDGVLRLLSFSDYRTMASIPILLPGETVVRGHALATDPISGEIVMVLELAGRPPLDSSLATIDPYSGDARLIGDLGDVFSSITFDSRGTLWGMTPTWARLPSALHTVDPATAIPSFRASLPGGDGGEEIAYQEDADLLWHVAGASARVQETVDPQSLALSPVPITGLPWARPTSVFYDTEALWFIMACDSVMYRIYRDGLATQFSISDHTINGLTYVTCDTCGDCDLDGQPATVLDALAAARLHAGLDTPASAQRRYCCDVDQDRAVTVLDALVMAQEAVGLPVVLDCFQ